MKRLPDTELEVMKALWDAGADVPRAVLDQALAPFQWASNTVNTYLSRLAEKGFVSVRREGRSNLYTPLVSQEDYLAGQSRRFLDQLCGGSLSTFANALCSSGLTRQELDELRDLLNGGKL